MYTLNAFVTIHPWVSNARGVVAPVGEASPKALTYSREVALINKAQYDNVSLLVFGTERDGVYTPAEIQITDLILEVASSLYTRSINGQLSEDLSSTRALIENLYGNSIQITELGKMVSTGVYWFPESITFTHKTLGEDNQSRVWFTDSAFRSECDVYEILSIVPLDNPNDLHGPRAQVLAQLSAMTPADYTIKLQELTAAHPQTTIVSRVYDWHDKVDPTITKPSYFTAIVYGGAGNNEDLIRTALQNYLLSNSTWNREQWELVYPDLFKPLEYFITPVWDRYSLPQQVEHAGVYSPILPYAKALEYGVGTFFGQPSTHIQEHMSVVASIYKSLPFVSVGNFRNRRNLFAFDQLWPKYAAISTTSFDFNRMPLSTQQFIMHLVEHLKYAESFTPLSDVPAGYTVVQRSGKYYLTKTFEKVVYYVWCKFNDYPTEPVIVPPEPAQFTLNLVHQEQDGSQFIQAVLRKVGEPSALDPAVVVDWVVEGNWFNTRIEDSDSTQLIPVTVTNSDVGSAVHTVKAQFTYQGVSLEVTGTVTLLPVQTPAISYSLVASYAPDTSIRVRVLRSDGQLAQAQEFEDPILFTARHDRWQAGRQPISVLTTETDYLLDAQSTVYQDLDDFTYTITAELVPFGADPITLTTSLENVASAPVIDSSFSLVQTETSAGVWTLTLKDETSGDPITLPNAAYFEVCQINYGLGGPVPTGTKVFEAGVNSTELTVVLPEAYYVVRYGFTQNGVTKARAEVIWLSGPQT